MTSHTVVNSLVADGKCELIGISNIVQVTSTGHTAILLLQYYYNKCITVFSLILIIKQSFTMIMQDLTITYRYPP